MLRLLLCFLLFTACSSASNSTITPEQIKQEFSFLKGNLVKYHPGIYRYTSEDSIDYYFEKAAHSDGPIDSLELYARITSLLSKIRCGHTRSRMSDELRNSFEQNQLFIPFSIKILAGKFYVNKTLDSQLKSGDEILAINGQPMEEIQNEIFDHLPSDGLIITGKRKATEYFFDVYLQLYVTKNTKRYNIRLRDQRGVNRECMVKGISINEVNSIRNEISSGELLSINYSKRYAYMRIGTFGEQLLFQNGINYEMFLGETFAELKERQTPNLILDLRGNGGGKDNFGALLVSYLAKTPFHYFERIEVTPQYPGNSEKIGDQYLWTDHQGLSVWEPHAYNFEGNVYVLIDGRSFSTCADVATVLHYHKWATFIGEETGGGYDGNTSGHTMTIELPISKAKVSIPMWKYTTANRGHTYQGRGVLPDYTPPVSWDDFHANRDVVYNKALELISSSQK